MAASYKSYKAEVLSALSQQIKVALEVCGGTAENYAVDDCPVDTGRLRNSITHSPDGDNSVQIGTNEEYAPYVELGTRRMRAHPYLRPALDNHAQQYNDIFNKTLNG